MPKGKGKKKGREESGYGSGGPPKVVKAEILNLLEGAARVPAHARTIWEAFHPESPKKRKKLTARELAGVAKKVKIAEHDDVVAYLIRHWGERFSMDTINDGFCDLADAVYETGLPVHAWWVQVDGLEQLSIQVVREERLKQIGFFVLSPPPSKDDLEELGKILKKLLAKSLA